MAGLVLKGMNVETLDSTIEVGLYLRQTTLEMRLDYHMDCVCLEDIQLTRGLIVPIQHVSEDTLRRS